MIGQYFAVFSLVVLVVLPPCLVAELSKCLDLKQVKIDKNFRQKFLSGRVYFPMGQKLDILDNPDFEVDHPVFPPIQDGGRPKCFGLTVRHYAVEGKFEGSETKKLPFNCIRDTENKVFCHLNTKATKDTSHMVPLELWGSATVVKTDNREYMLVVSCNSNKKPSWILLHRYDTIPLELEQEINDFVSKFGFDTQNSFSVRNPQKVVLLWMDMESKCPKNVWPPQVQ